jgi:hypothetical protein
LNRKKGHRKAEQRLGGDGDGTMLQRALVSSSSILLAFVEQFLWIPYLASRYLDALR